MAEPEPEPTLTLYAEPGWVSPWVFHAMVALEEKRLPYGLEVVWGAELHRDEIRERAIICKVPILVHGDAWITESVAISEYLAEQFPFPRYPRLFPADLVQRARARQLMSALRTGFFALREARPTSGIFGAPDGKPLAEQAKAEADELVRIAGALLRPGAAALFGEWCIADADLALALMRLVSSGDPMPQAIANYAVAVWSRPSVQKFLGHAPTRR
jgi:glutathione S-transferase